jgi:hypothetical protein
MLVSLGRGPGRQWELNAGNGIDVVRGARWEIHRWVRVARDRLGGGDVDVAVKRKEFVV